MPKTAVRAARKLDRQWGSRRGWFIMMKWSVASVLLDVETYSLVITIGIANNNVR